MNIYKWLSLITQSHKIAWKKKKKQLYPVLNNP